MMALMGAFWTTQDESLPVQHSFASLQLPLRTTSQRNARTAMRTNAHEPHGVILFRQLRLVDCERQVQRTRDVGGRATSDGALQVEAGAGMSGTERRDRVDARMGREEPGEWRRSRREGRVGPITAPLLDGFEGACRGPPGTERGAGGWVASEADVCSLGARRTVYYQAFSIQMILRYFLTKYVE